MTARYLFVYGNKGGVGKTTVAVNLAFAIAERGHDVGLLDLDLSGPNIPDLVSGLHGEPPTMRDFRVLPGEYGGVAMSSLGFFVAAEHAPYLAGRYLSGALDQLLPSEHWPSLDVVVVDMPPGFSDLHRRVFDELEGAVLAVSTPHLLARQDTSRGLELLAHLGVPVLGIVENLAHVVCAHCRSETPLLGFSGGGETWPATLIESLPFDSTPDQAVNVPAMLGSASAGNPFRAAMRSCASTVLKQLMGERDAQAS